MNWRNNPEFRKHFREYRELNMSEQKKWYEEQYNFPPKKTKQKAKVIRKHRIEDREQVKWGIEKGRHKLYDSGLKARVGGVERAKDSRRAIQPLTGYIQIRLRSGRGKSLMVAAEYLTISSLSGYGGH